MNQRALELIVGLILTVIITVLMFYNASISYGLG